MHSLRLDRINAINVTVGQPIQYHLYSTWLVLMARIIGRSIDKICLYIFPEQPNHTHLEH